MLDERRRLPVWRTIAAVYRFMLGNWQDALRIGWLPVLAVIGLGGVLQYLPGGGDWSAIARLSYAFAIWAAYALIVAVAVVPWHRKILLDERVRSGVLAVALTAREARYAFVCVAIMVVMSVMGWAGWSVLGRYDWFSDTEPIAIAALGAVLHLVLLAAYLYASSVLSLALPAVAVDRKAGSGAGFALAFADGWRLVLVLLAASVPYVAYYHAIGYLPASALAGVGAVVAAIPYSVVFVLQALLIATALSLSYRALGGFDGDGPISAAHPPGGNA